MTKDHYLTNAELRHSIFRSKLSFCNNMRDATGEIFSEPPIMMDSISDPTWFHWGYERTATDKRPKRVIVRTDRDFSTLAEGELVMAHDDHYMNVPKPRFPAFQLWQMQSGKMVEVSRCFWEGLIEDGHYADKGRQTNRLGQQILLGVDRYARQPNWAGYSYIDEMKAKAIVALVQNFLKYDSRRTENPFAFMWTNIYYAFIRVNDMEKKQAAYRKKQVEEAMCTNFYSEWVAETFEAEYEVDRQQALQDHHARYEAISEMDYETLTAAMDKLLYIQTNAANPTALHREALKVLPIVSYEGARKKLTPASAKAIRYGKGIGLRLKTMAHFFNTDISNVSLVASGKRFADA